MTARRAHFHLEIWRRSDDRRFEIDSAAIPWGISTPLSIPPRWPISAPRRLRNNLVLPALVDLVRCGQSLRLLDHDCPSHFGMNGTEVGVSTGRSGDDCELLIGIERARFLELLFDADHRVRFVVPIDPGDLLPGFHRQGLGAKIKVLDYNLIVPGARGRGFFLVLAESKVGQE